MVERENSSQEHVGRASESSDREEIPRLPSSFYSRLIDQPACLTSGKCDSCGRCQH